MGYDLSIGEAYLDHYPDEHLIMVRAKLTTHPDAPDHDSYVGQGNLRSPSYGGWADFCREAGPEVYELFFGGGWNRADRRYDDCAMAFHRERPLIDTHPGHAALCQGDLDVVRKARIRREHTNGGAPPGFNENNEATGWVEVETGRDPCLARLIWLEFWMGWALENCEIPVFVNR